MPSSSPTGEVRISAAAANGHFTVSVRDTGPGIAEEHRVRIFEQFHQIDSSNTKAKGGTGLGHAIAKQIVEIALRSHLGRIHVGQGVDLPYGASCSRPECEDYQVTKH
jgi:signal transduction histidine kinase